MRRLWLFIAALTSFTVVTEGELLKKTLSIFICSLFSFKLTPCYLNSKDSQVNAANPRIQDDSTTIIAANGNTGSKNENFSINTNLPTLLEPNYKLDTPLQIAIPPIIRSPEVNLYIQNALPKDFRISNQMPFRSGKQEILLVSPSTGAEQLYTFNLPGASSFQLFEVEYRKVSAIDFSSLTSTNSLVVNPEQIKSALNQFKIGFTNNSLSKVTLSDGTKADFSSGQAVIKAPNGQQVETIQISQSELIENNATLSQELRKFSKNQSSDRSYNLLAKSSESACQAAVSSSLNGVSDNLGRWGNKLIASNSATTKSIGWALAFASGALKSNISSKNPMLQEVNCRPPVQCEEKRVSGGSEIRTDLFQTAKGSSRKVNLEFEFFEIPDRLELYFDGKQIFSVGPQPGHNSKTFDLPDKAEYVGVKLIGNDDKNTRWWYTISCSGGSPEIIALDKWWATVGENTLAVTLKVKVPRKGKYSLDIDAENLPDWTLTDKAQVEIDGKPKPFDSSSRGRVDLGELDIGERYIKINSFKVPSKPIVEKIIFHLKNDNSQQDSFVAFFVADRSESIQSSYKIQGESKPLNGVTELINHFAPVLYFEERGKIQFPHNAEATFNSTEKKAKIGSNQPREGDSETYLNLATAPRSPNCQNSNQVPTNKAVNLQANKKVYASIPPEPGKQIKRGVVYASVIEKDDVIDPDVVRAMGVRGAPVQPTKNRELAINYYFFYPLSNWKDYGGYNTHEGDWEGVTVFLRWDGNQWVPNRMAYAQHLHSKRFRWNELRFDSSGRPEVYVGLGGHASYPVPNKTTVISPPGWDFKSPNRDELHQGRNKFDSKNRVEYLPRVGKLNSEHWLLYPGQWGHPDLDCDGNNRDGDGAPRGPVFLDVSINKSEAGERGLRWLNPWNWSL